MQPNETPIPQPAPAVTPNPATPPQPAGNIMDVTAATPPAPAAALAPAQQSDEVAQEPIYEDDEQSEQPAEPAKHNSPLPTLLTKEEQAAAHAEQPQMLSNKTPGVGLAIAATTIIVITLAVLAFLAFIKQT